MSQAIPKEETSVSGEILHMAMELGETSWKLAFGLGKRERRVSVAGGDSDAVWREIERARRRFGLSEDVGVVSCYEAGRDGFWLHRWLVSRGVENVVVDSSAIPVDRRARRAKSDGIDVAQLLRLLVRHVRGDDGVWKLVRVPSVEDEDVRRVQRELGRLRKERTAHTNRIRSLLVLHGLRLRGFKDFGRQVEGFRLFDGTPLPRHLRAELLREWDRLKLVSDQIRTIERECLQSLKTRCADDKRLSMVARLYDLRALGEVSSFVFVDEFFAWREFRNGRQVGALSGLVPMPYSSGQMQREQGISKAGNVRVRTLAIQIAWGWLRFQPDSALSRWYQERFANGGARLRRIGIVALARRLLVALWRYLEFGEIPEGAVMKS